MKFFYCYSWLKASFTLLHSQLLPGCLGRTQFYEQEMERRNEGKNIKKQSLTLNWRWQDQTAFLCPLSKLSYHGHWLSAFACQTSLKFDLCSCKTSLFNVQICLWHFAIILISLLFVCLSYCCSYWSFPSRQFPALSFPASILPISSHQLVAFSSSNFIRCFLFFLKSIIFLSTKSHQLLSLFSSHH